jgi:hypothetical protein
MPLETFSSDSLASEKIATVISGFIISGIPAAKDVLSFAESTLGIADVNELVRVLSEADSYGEGLIDLVFSPHQGLRIAIEPFIPPGGLSPEEISIIIGLILHDMKSVRVLIADADITADVALTEPLIGRFMQKLNLRKPLPFRDTDLIFDSLSDEAIVSIRVLIRNSRYQSSPDRDRTIVSLINGLGRMTGGGDTGIIHDSLIQLIELFNENIAIGDFHSFLSVKKHQYAEILEKSARFSEYLSRYSMEFLMSNKIQPPAAGIDEMRKKIYLIDLISTAVFGKPAESSPVDVTLHFDINDGNES